MTHLRTTWHLRSLAVLAACAAGQLGFAAPQAEHHWSYAETAQAVPQAVSLGNGGTVAFAAVDGYFSSRARLLSGYDVDPASVVWERIQAGEARQARVASAEDADRHALLQLVPSGVGGYRVQVRAFDSASSVPRWTWTSPTSMAEHDRLGVHVSADGSTVVAVFYLMVPTMSQVVVFNAATGAVQLDTQLNTFLGFHYSALSRDARTLYLGFESKSYVVNLANQGAMTTVLTWVPAYRGHAMTPDVSRFACGAINSVRVFDRNGDGSYSQSSILMPGGLDFSVNRLALSQDGRYLVAGLVPLNTRNVRIITWNLVTGAKLMDQTLHGTGNYTVDVSGLAMAADGSRFAVGTFGDEGGLLPHLLLYETGASQPYAQYHLGGSLMGLAMSQDGSRLVVARKSTHANVGASGGSLEYFSTKPRDVTVLGIPRLNGPPVRIRVQSSPGQQVYVLSNHFLEVPPLPFQAGHLYVGRPGIVLSALAPEGGGSYGMDWSFSSQAGNFIGQTLYFQGLRLAPRTLSQDFAAVTVLP